MIVLRRSAATWIVRDPLPGNRKSIVRSAGFQVTRDNTVTVPLGAGSRQEIWLDPDRSPDALYAWSTIATRRTVENSLEEQGTVLEYAWERNRLSELVGFAIDRYGRLFGEVWIPLEGLTPDEAKVYLNELARVCDWHEFRLAGEDRY
jgi:hypothetical protein